MASAASIPYNNQLTNGKWAGVLGGSCGSGNFEGTFKGQRQP